MRRALFIAAACAACLSQPGLAYDNFFITVKFSKPNISYSEFQADRNACLGLNSHQGWTTAGGGGWSQGSWALPATPTYNFAHFGNCMVVRGYTPDPNGIHATKFYRMGPNLYRLVRL